MITNHELYVWSIKTLQFTLPEAFIYEKMCFLNYTTISHQKIRKII